nr:NADH dehydrogenase subunit 6 [Penthicodes atomaria]
MSIKYMILMNILTSMMLKHPISLGSMLILQTTLICLNQSMMNKSPWYMYILFLTTVGGLMIMFMYMASIASNEMFNFNIKLMITWIMMMILINLIMINKDLTMEMMLKIKEIKLSITELSEEKTTSKFFSMYKMNITITMMMILMLTLVSVTNISSTFEGPLKKTYV